MYYVFLSWASGVSEHHWILPFPSSDFVRLPFSFLGLGYFLEAGHSYPGEPLVWTKWTLRVELTQLRRWEGLCPVVTVHFLTKELEELSEGQENRLWCSGWLGLCWIWRGFCHRMQNAGLDPSRQRQLFSLRANNQERDFSPILVFYAKSYTLRFGPAAFFFFFQWVSN